MMAVYNAHHAYLDAHFFFFIYKPSGLDLYLILTLCILKLDITVTAQRFLAARARFDEDARRRVSYSTRQSVLSDSPRVSRTVTAVAHNNVHCDIKFVIMFFVRTFDIVQRYIRLVPSFAAFCFNIS